MLAVGILRRAIVSHLMSGGHKMKCWSVVQFGLFAGFLGFAGSGPALSDDTESALAEALNVRLEETQSIPADTLLAMSAFYEGRDYAPVWVSAQGFNAAGANVIDEIKRADDWGLNSSDFDIPALVSDGTALPVESLADAEIRLSLAVLKYAADARGGRIPEPDKQLSSYLDRKPELLPPQEVLVQIAAAADPGVYLSGLNPQHEQFQRLRRVYRKLREDAESVAAAPVPASGKLIHPGQTDPDVGVVRKRLGLLAAPGQENVYDDGMVRAVKRFQKEKRLGRADGLIGRRTRRALNEAPGKEMDAILANMEEWRWMPADLGQEYVLVNVPSFTVDLVRGGRTLFSERIVTGKPEAQTPIFSGNMQTIVLHPNWYVPESIKIKEMLPKLLRGRSLESMGFRIVRGGKEVDSRSIDWDRADIRKYDVYQVAGDDNALGQVKFLFPNKHAVYLHDTPMKRLFKSSVRTFSHGCVRVRNPLKFAQLLLGGDMGWDPQHVADLMENGPFDNAITLAKPVPVHISYFTVWVDDDGSARFMDDVYGHQKRINLALNGKWDEIDKGKDHLAPVEMVRTEPRSRTSRQRVVTSGKRRSRGGSSFAWTGWSAPMGLTSSGSGSRATRSAGSTADDIFRRSFGN
jgi:murein L,D-transpeptidase YcbB/YkuD